MKRLLLAAVLTAAIGGSALPAAADTLYVSGPPAAAPGHPLRLGADHRASQVGDLIAVLFNYSVLSNVNGQGATAKGYNVAQGAGTGSVLFGFLRFPTNITGSTSSNRSKTQSDTSSFQNAMMATITNVLPSGALAIAGDEKIVINGQLQTVHVTGLVRPEDVDFNDTVLSSRIANLDTTFSGDFQQKNRGIIRRILDFLF